MNGRKVEDGGILYDENETDDEDELQEAPAATAAVTPGIDWNEGGGAPEGLVGAELIVLTQSGSSGEIRAIHWSSYKP